MGWDGVYSSGVAGVYASAPSTLVKVGAFLALIVIVSCVIPLRRAARMNPTAALRHD
jgi:ABC-type antimicrobial peptide transport system permease subunit